MRDLRSDLASLRIERKLPSRRARWWLIPIAAALLLGGGGYAVWTAMVRSAVPEVEAARPVVVKAGESVRRDLVNAAGYVVARRKAVVSAKIQGRLGELRVEEGSVVKEGEVIARLESSDYEAQVERAKAAVERAEAELAEYQRQLRLSEGLTKEGVTSADEVDAGRSRVRIAEASLRQAQAELGVARALLDNTFIRAPFSGVVIKKMAEVGESVAPIPPGVNVSTSSGAVVALADMDTLEVEADVNESHIAKLKQGQPTEVVVEAFPGRRYRAVLRQVIPSADRTKATVLVKVTILDKDADLKPEMSARATFFEEEKPASPAGASQGARILIPREAVVTAGGTTRVFVILDEAARERVVVLGEEAADSVAVREGLTGSETLVLRPPPGLKDGDRVRVK